MLIFLQLGVSVMKSNDQKMGKKTFDFELTFYEKLMKKLFGVSNCGDFVCELKINDTNPIEINYLCITLHFPCVFAGIIHFF